MHYTGNEQTTKGSLPAGGERAQSTQAPVSRSPPADAGGSFPATGLAQRRQVVVNAKALYGVPCQSSDRLGSIDWLIDCWATKLYTLKIGHYPKED